MYDYLLIGGGISSLYLAYNLTNNFNLKIGIIEKDTNFGGRIYSVKKNINNKKYLFEAGAGRFNDNHNLLNNLISELNLNNKKKIIKNNIEYYKNENFDYKLYFNKLLIECEKLNKKQLINTTLNNISVKIFNKKDYNRFINQTEYYSEFFILNAYDSLRSIKNNYNSKYFYILNGGLSQISDKIIRILKKKENCDLINNTLFEKYDYIKNNYQNYYIITLNNNGNIYTLKCKNLVFSISLKNLLKINKINKIKSLSCLDSVPLCRIYAIYKNLDWYTYNGKLTVDNDIKYIIPVDLKNGLIMISYTDGPLAIKWNEKDLNGELLNHLNKNLSKIFKKFDKNPLFLKSYYWENGCTFWKKGCNSFNLSKKLLKPFKSQNLFIIGESVSTNQAWIEGSLETSKNLFLKIMDNIINSNNNNNNNLNNNRKDVIFQYYNVVKINNTNYAVYSCCTNCALNVKNKINKDFYVDNIDKNNYGIFKKGKFIIKLHNCKKLKNIKCIDL